MKHLTLIMHANLKQDAADILSENGNFDQFTFSDVEGHGNQTQTDEFLSARDKVVGYVPRVKLDILVEDHEVTQILLALRQSKIGTNSHTFYWVSDIESCGRLSQIDTKNDHVLSEFRAHEAPIQKASNKNFK